MKHANSIRRTLPDGILRDEQRGTGQQVITAPTATVIRGGRA